jgi:hypothetical protein
MKIKLSFFIFFVGIAALFSCKDKSSKPDNGFDISVSNPKWITIHPTILFDEAHHNHHRIDNTYKPFARLITNDGCTVRSTDKIITADLLHDVSVFIIATAMGMEDPGDKSPFVPGEIETLEEWVKGGGSVLLITEHYPFGLAMTPLLSRFGVKVHNGFTEDTLLSNKEVADALLFEKAKGNLNTTHPILEQVNRINTFTGSAVQGDSSWTPLIIFSNSAQNYNVKVDVKREGGDITTSVSYTDFYPAKGWVQGMCRQYGKGRIAVLAESAFLTAQTDKNGNKFGMNIPNTDNKQFTLNLIRWLSEKE